MRKILLLAMVFVSVPILALDSLFTQLDVLEGDAKKTSENFNDLSKNMSVASISQSIVMQDEKFLKQALQDVISLNKTVNTQVNLAIQFWNMYLSSVKMPTMDSYLLGQVMNTLIGTIRALSLRSSLDQALILNLIKHNNDRVMQPAGDLTQAIEAKGVSIEDRWQRLKI